MLRDTMKYGIRRTLFIAGVAGAATIWIVIVAAMVKLAFTYLTTGAPW